MVPPCAFTAQPHTAAGPQHPPLREPHRLQGFTLLGKELRVLPAEGQRLATHRGADLPGGLSSEPSAPQVLPGPQRPATNSQQGGDVQREQPPSPQPCTSSQQAGGNKASEPPLPTHGIVPEREPSLCTSSLPLWGHSCGASAPWSHLLLKPLWAGEGSHSHSGPTVPGSCLPSLGRCPFIPESPQLAPRSAPPSSQGGHGVGGRRCLREPEGPRRSSLRMGPCTGQEESHPHPPPPPGQQGTLARASCSEGEGCAAGL